MAQNARVAALTDELIQSIIGFDADTNKRAYKHAKEIATKGLRAHQYNRTNQFEVQSSFSGLDEKFRVLNRDDLADAVSPRVTELEGIRNKWIPEYLSLLLQLSDQPTKNSNVEALQLLRPPTPPSPLTWSQILDEDPYSDEEIWKDIDYAAESSEDEKAPRRKEKKSEQSPPSSIEEDSYRPESYVVPISLEPISKIKDAQFWEAQADEETGKVNITELQALRESLFMLAGLQTSVYLMDQQHSNIRVNHMYILSHAMEKTADHLLSQFANIGRELSHLRQWVKRPSSLPLIQTFEAAVKVRLLKFDRSLAQLQQRYLVSETPVSVSLLQLLNEIQTMARPLLRLAQLVADIEPQLLVNPFVHLETLFEQITLAQMTLEKDVFEFFSRLFFESLQIYLKPIRKWMEFGELGANDETFFIFENDSGSEASSLWHDRYVLRRGQGDALRSPVFLQPAAMKIFNTGKSVIFLKELGIYGAGLESSSDAEPRLDHETVCRESELPICPFPELFQEAFDLWIRSKYSLASTVLRTHLFTQCGLLKILGKFSVVFLGANGSVFQDFAGAIFQRMDTNQRGWNDRFLLTELARGIYATAVDKEDAEKIVVRSVRVKNHSRMMKGLGTISLDYALPWAVMNIIQRSSMPVYQQLFTFLLQTYRAKYLLQNVQTKSIRQIKDHKLSQLSLKLRNELIWFSDILRSYLTETVVTLSNDEMMSAMEKAEDIDEMSTIHIKYLARLQEQSLLAENLKPIHRAITSLLDLGGLFHDTVIHQVQANTTQMATHVSVPKSPAKPPSKASRRKSVIPALIEEDTSGSAEDEVVIDNEGNEKSPPNKTTPEAILKTIDEEFARLLPFVIAGLKNIGRVGAEPVWEMLAERLEWDKKKEMV